MPDTDEESDFQNDEYDITTRLSLRDYPSTVLVLIGVLGSGLAWLLYKRSGRANAMQPAASRAGENGDVTGRSHHTPGVECGDDR